MTVRLRSLRSQFPMTNGGTRKYVRWFGRTVDRSFHGCTNSRDAMDPRDEKKAFGCSVGRQFGSSASNEERSVVREVRVRRGGGSAQECSSGVQRQAVSIEPSVISDSGACAKGRADRAGCTALGSTLDALSALRIGSFLLPAACCQLDWRTQATWSRDGEMWILYSVFGVTR